MTPVRAANETMHDCLTILSSPLSAQETIRSVAQPRERLGRGGVYCILQPVIGEWAGRREHHHHQFHVADEGRRVVAPPCPRSTARLQRSPIGRREQRRATNRNISVKL